MSHGYGVARKAMRELITTYGARGKGRTGAAAFEGQQVPVASTTKETLARVVGDKVLLKLGCLRRGDSAVGFFYKVELSQL